MSPGRTLLRAVERSVARQRCLQSLPVAAPLRKHSFTSFQHRLPQHAVRIPPSIAQRRYATTSHSHPDGPEPGTHTQAKISSPGSPVSSVRRLRSHRLRRLLALLALLSALLIFYQTLPPFRHIVIASVRCARLMKAVLLAVWDYKSVFAKEELLTDSDEDRATRRARRKECHLRSANRMLEALKTNSGIYVKIGQHVAAVQLLPQEWTSTMRPLQDQCFPTPIEKINEMLVNDLGTRLDDLFIDIDPVPIGVASLAQVHRATDRETGKRVAIKVQHPDLQEFAKVDMKTVNFAIALVKRIFPDFEFSWLGEEMNVMLPLEMDFRHEASNSRRARGNFKHLEGKTSVYFPEILWAERRCMVMEFIEGARVDDLAYLKDHNIDRNQVSQELSRIFSQMVYMDGYFHADPHHGNLLIRSKAKGSKSPYNFDICLLDHGQYFDVPDDLRVNYARFWLSLIQRTSESTTAERKKYAKLVGNIDDDMYPILESAITGRINMSDAGNEHDSMAGSRPSSLLDEKHMDDKEIAKLRAAVMERDGLIVSIFELLRTVPRRLLMILKLSDLQRSLDQSLATTHGQSRIFLIVARYCADAVWRDDLIRIRQAWRRTGFTLNLVSNFVSAFWSHAYWSMTLGVAEWGMDVRARIVKMGLWIHGLQQGGLAKAREQAAGLH